MFGTPAPLADGGSQLTRLARPRRPHGASQTIAQVAEQRRRPPAIWPEGDVLPSRSLGLPYADAYSQGRTEGGRPHRCQVTGAAAHGLPVVLRTVRLCHEGRCLCPHGRCSPVKVASTVQDSIVGSGTTVQKDARLNF